MSECPICLGETTADLQYGTNVNVRHIECPRCGKYQISVIAASQYQASLGDKGSRKRANASGWVWDNQGVTLGAADEHRLVDVVTPSFQSRVDKLMLLIEKASESFADTFVVHFECWLGRTWCKNDQELLYLLNYLEQTRRIVSKGGSGNEQVYQLTPEGLAFLENLHQLNPKSHQGFVAMWFHKCMTPVYDDFIAPAIRDAGYEPKRIDRKEYLGKVDDEIIAEIRRSRFLVADFTGHRGGVYYEAGFAHGLNIPVIFTCRAKELRRLHFDVRQYVTIDWESPDDLRDRLKIKIEAILGHGPILTKNVVKEH